jgi:rSAM/selenodomain-associated transferase 1
MTSGPADLISDRSPCRVLVFARVPELGKVKTRLEKGIGAAGALAAHRELLMHTIAVVATFTARSERAERARTAAELCIAGEDSQGECAALAERHGMMLSRQDCGDLGDRMASALSAGLARGERTVIVGSDCPVLAPGDLSEAFDRLARVEVVLAPSEDGGYALIGAARSLPPVFGDMPWSTSGVLAQTVDRLERAGLRYSLMRTLWDVDDQAGWQRWQALQPAGSGRPTR